MIDLGKRKLSEQKADSIASAILTLLYYRLDDDFDEGKITSADYYIILGKLRASMEQKQRRLDETASCSIVNVAELGKY